MRVESIRKYNRSRAVPYHLRSPDRIAGFFDSLELVDPGVVPRNHWRPDNDEPPAPSDGVGAVGRKP